MLVPVGCVMTLPELDHAEAGRVAKKALNWLYDRSLERKLHVKATSASHHFRVMRQRGEAGWAYHAGGKHHIGGCRRSCATSGCGRRSS